MVQRRMLNQVILTLWLLAPLPHLELLIIGKRVLRVKSRKENERKNQRRRGVEAQAVTESQERMDGKMITVDQEAGQGVDQVVLDVGLLAEIDDEETMTEKVVEDIIKVLIEMVTETVKKTVTGRGIAIEIGNGIGTEIGIEIEEEIGTGIGDGGTAVDLVVIPSRIAARGVHQTPGHRLYTGIGQEPGPDPGPGLRPGHTQPRGTRSAPGSESRPLRVPIGLLVRSHQGTDARTEQLVQGGILFLHHILA